MVYYYNMSDYSKNLQEYTKDFIFEGNDYFNGSFKAKEALQCNYCGDIIHNGYYKNDISIKDVQFHYNTAHPKLNDVFIKSNGELTKELNESYTKIYTLSATIAPLSEEQIEFFNTYRKLEKDDITSAYAMLEQRKKKEDFIDFYSFTASIVTAILLSIFTVQFIHTGLESQIACGLFLVMGFAMPLLGLSTFLSNKLIDKLPEFKPRVFNDISTFKNYTTSEKDKYLLDDIAEELTEACKNGDGENFKIIINNLSRMNEEGEKEALHRKNIIDDNFNAQIANENETKLQRKISNPVLTGAVISNKNRSYTDTPQYHKLSKILSKELMIKIVKLNEEFEKHSSGETPLTITDKIKMDNCKNEYTDNVTNLLKMSETLPITLELENDLEKLVDTCLVIMDTVGSGMIEKSKDTVNISNIFLTQKYEELFKEKSGRDFEVIERDTNGK